MFLSTYTSLCKYLIQELTHVNSTNRRLLVDNTIKNVRRRIQNLTDSKKWCNARTNASCKGWKYRLTFIFFLKEDSRCISKENIIYTVAINLNLYMNRKSTKIGLCSVITCFNKIWLFSMNLSENWLFNIVRM